MLAPLCDGLVLAFPGDWRLWVLNAEAAIIWELYSTGLSPVDMADQLARYTGIDPGFLQRQISELVAEWQSSGLLEAARRNCDSTDSPDAGPPSGSPPLPLQPPETAFRCTLADTELALSVTDASIAATLRPLLAGLQGKPQEGRPLTALLQLSGTLDDWQLNVNDALCASGDTHDGAVVTMLGEIIERACRTPERLLVVHGAGLVMPDGRGLLLIAPGGSGKTTLATALNAGGWSLLSDDVVPVNLDGTLAGLGAPICLKSGSWPVLEKLRPDLSTYPVIQRYDQSIRYLPPLGSPPPYPVPVGMMLFPRFEAGCTPRIEPMTPLSALQGLIEAEAVVRHLTQDRLDRLVQWVSAAPACAITYPDLESARNLVQRLLDGGFPETTDA